jgi:hypothetical protein
MVVYRVDFLDEEGGVSISGSLVYRKDREVLHAAAHVIGHHQAVEVWDYTRVVGRLTAKDCERLRQRAARHRPDPHLAAVVRTVMTG